MALLGADTDELREVGQEFEQGKEVVDDVITFLRALIAILRAASFFSGGASLAYAEYLETTVLPWLQKISQALGMFAKVLTSQAQAQDETSDGAKVDLATLPSYSTPALPAAIKPYQGQPIVGGAADGAVAAGSTGSQVGSAPATTTRTDTTVPGVTTTTTTTTTTTSAAPTGVGAAASAVGALGAAGAIGGSSGLGSTTPDARSAPSLTGSWPSTPGSSSLGSVGGLADRDLSTSGSGHAATLGSAGGIGGSSGSGGSVGPGSSGGVGGSTGSGALGGHGLGDLGGSGGGSVHTNTPVDGALGGATPGSTATTGGDLAAGHQPSSGSPIGTAAIGAAATGAAALGIGGAALAARGGAAGSGSIDSLATQVGRGSKGPGVTAMQEQLTAAGYDTQGADGAWGRDTEAAYQAYRADHPLEVRAGTGYTSPDGYDYGQITGIRNATPEFLRSVEAMSQRVGAQPEHVLAAMSFETGGTFAADAKNPHSSATGLIQFMDKTAAGMGTSTAALAAMTPTEQLTYVERYLQPFHGRLGDLDSVYSSILAGHPASGEDVLFRGGTPAYAANAPLDSNGNGAITASEAAAHVRTRLGTGSN